MEAPIASHAIYTRFPKSEIKEGAVNYQGHVADAGSDERREHGIQCGFALNKHAGLCAVYTDHGISRGMEYGIQFAKDNGTPIEYRTLYNHKKT
jgi:hypothetical protein